MNTKEAIELLEARGYKVYDDGKPEDERENIIFLREGGSISSRDKKRYKELQDQKFNKKKGKKLFRLWNADFYYGLYTGRELVSFAKSVDSYGYYKTFVKKLSNQKDRRAIRDNLKKQDFDKIPQNKNRASNLDDYW